jgi:hypothetical protein
MFGEFPSTKMRQNYANMAGILHLQVTNYTKAQDYVSSGVSMAETGPFIDDSAVHRDCP